jgi:hypothetical protein
VIAGNPGAIGLLILSDLPYFAGRQIQFDWSANYWTALLLLWLALAAYQARRPQPAGQPVPVARLPTV